MFHKALPLALVIAATSAMGAPIVVTQTTSSSALSTALGGGGILSITSAVVQNGAAGQFGTFTGYDGGPVTIGNGIVLSTGQVSQLTPANNNGVQGVATQPSNDTSASGTTSYTDYATGRVANFSGSANVASLLVTFTLSSASQIGFDFIFGSVEYPEFTSNYTDAFFAFVDGTAAANQIVFDGAGNPVQVGATFASALSTADTNTAFGNPHGVLQLTTISLGTLSAGTHTILFEVGDVNDAILDSAVFISNFRATAGTGGTNATGAPEPGTWALLISALAGLKLIRSRQS